MTAPTEDRFRALARSGPWRFTTLRFTHRRADGESVDALLRRPGWLRVRTASGAEHVVTGVPYARQVLHLDGRPAVPIDDVLPADVAVDLDPDGFVAVRPTAVAILWDDPMWRSFDWVAMLDPVELSTGTVVRELAATTRHGRETWWARMSASDGYDPRCDCCPLLGGEVAEWLVGLDVGTGVVVSTEPLGGERDDLGFTVTIHAVDEPDDNGPTGRAADAGQVSAGGGRPT